MKVCFANGSIRQLGRDRIEGAEDGEEGSAERRRPRNGVDGVGDGVGDGVASPGESSKSLLNVGKRLRRTDGCARFLQSFE